MEPKQDCLKHQKPVPYDWFSKTYQDDEEIQPLFDYILEDESINSFWASPTGDKLLTISTYLNEIPGDEHPYKVYTELKLYDFNGQILSCLSQINS